VLVLKRKEGQWVEITHKSGDVLRVRVYDIHSRSPARVNLAFDDDARNFLISRPDGRGGPADAVDASDSESPLRPS
jgi:hypothetical protein